jgi:Arc/MetJ family transcription regulator
MMRTNIVLDDSLVDEAFKYSTAKTKRELIHVALVEFINNHRCKDLRELKGIVKISDDYNYKALRTDLTPKE